VANAGTVSFRTFLFPGVLATSVLFTAMFSAISIVWDREFGFLREMLVAPVRRGSILVGKCLGGATVATLQGLLVLVLAPFVDVPYDAVMLLELIVVMFLLAFSLTAFGLVIAARISNIQTVMGVMQVLLIPLAFLSGSLYPISKLPTWMSIVVRANPITYAVHLSRNIVFSNINATPAARAAKLAGVVGHWCIGTETFLMGVVAEGPGEGNAYWSLRCADGSEWAVQVDPLAEVTAIAVEYGLHEGRFWLPRLRLAEGDGPRGSENSRLSVFPRRFERSRGAL